MPRSHYDDKCRVCGHIRDFHSHSHDRRYCSQCPCREFVTKKMSLWEKVRNAYSSFVDGPIEYTYYGDRLFIVLDGVTRKPIGIGDPVGVAEALQHMRENDDLDDGEDEAFVNLINNVLFSKIVNHELVEECGLELIEVDFKTVSELVDSPVYNFVEFRTDEDQ